MVHDVDQKFNLHVNILKFHLGSKTAILKLNLVQIHSKSFYINGEVCLKVGVRDFLTLIFGKSQGNFGESLTPRLPLMHALIQYMYVLWLLPVFILFIYTCKCIEDKI